MYLTRMTFTSGACCATGELCCFISWGPKGMQYWGKTIEEQLKYIASSDYRNILERGHGKQADHYYGKGETLEEAWKNCLIAVEAEVNNYSYKGYQLRYFWFVKYNGSKTYENNKLRQVVQTMPDVLKLGEFVNANTGNTVDGYMMSFENKNGQNPEDKDEEDDYEW